MKRGVFISLLLLVVLTTLNLIEVYAQNNPVQVIGNQTGFSTSNLKEIKQIFRGKYSRWPNGNSVTIVLPAPKTTGADAMASYIYESSMSAVQKFWLSLVFQGRANPPVFLDDDSDIINYVRKTPGALGVVSANAQNIPKELLITVSR